MLHESVRRKVVEVSLALHRAGLIPLTSGNVSARASEEHIAITPRGIPYELLKPEDVVLVGLDGHVIEGSRTPSSETPMHTYLFRNCSNVGAVVHSHSVYSIAFSAVGRSIPIISLEGLVVKGPVPVADYACAGTEKQGEVALKALQGPPQVMGVLLRNHGLLAVGANLDQAYQIAYRIELSAQIHFLALQLGTPVALTDEQLDEVRRVYLNK
jgi:L-ribulose-5-phosphate 4-epimerase